MISTLPVALTLLDAVDTFVDAFGTDTVFTTAGPATWVVGAPDLFTTYASISFLVTLPLAPEPGTDSSSDNAIPSDAAIFFTKGE